MLIKECVIWCVWYPHKQPDMLSCQGLVRIRKEKAEAFTGIILGAISAPSHIDPFSNPCYVVLADEWMGYACESPLSELVPG